MKNTPRETSPYNLLQEQLRDEPWKLLIACVMLNQTSAKQVKTIIWDFFKRWSTPLEVCRAAPFEIEEAIRTLGLYRRRTVAIQRISREFCDTPTPDVENLYGVGKYALDSYVMFVDGVLVPDVQDKELQNYLRWATERKGPV